jgi:hypothetical protein
MKAQLKAKILGVERNAATTVPGSLNIHTGSLVKLKVAAEGKIDTTLNNAQQIIMHGDLFVKEVIANQMKIGATIILLLSDEESNESM